MLGTLALILVCLAASVVLIGSAMRLIQSLRKTAPADVVALLPDRVVGVRIRGRLYRIGCQVWGDLMEYARQQELGSEDHRKRIISVFGLPGDLTLIEYAQLMHHMKIQDGKWDEDLKKNYPLWFLSGSSPAILPAAVAASSTTAAPAVLPTNSPTPDGASCPPASPLPTASSST